MEWVKGVFNWLGLVIVVVGLAVFVFILAGVKYLIPLRHWRLKIQEYLNRFPKLWTRINNAFFSLTGLCDIELKGDLDLDLSTWYLMTANHNSWTDILLLHRVFNDRLPPLKFFMKQELKWIPFMGWGCWLIGYPFMKRYSKQILQKKPHLKGKDFQTTQKMCQRYKQGSPNTIISFAEGTRYTPEKAKRQNTPFKHLLKPRAGGLGYTLTLMQDKIDYLLDITIIYHGGVPTFWDFLCGRVSKVTMLVDKHYLDDQLKGDYQNDRQYRTLFQNWLNQLWEQKDRTIERYMQDANY